MKSLFIFSIIAFAALICLLGCNDKDIVTYGGDPGLGSIQIFMPVDTLRFLPGDSVSVPGYVVVKDGDGREKPGIKVNLELTENFGSLETVG